MEEINASIGFDRKLWRQDIRASLAHAAMLGKAGVISPEDVVAITDGLNGIAAEIEGDAFPFAAALEDIHMNIEARLTERIGEAGKRLHTGRSRNDQVATDFRLWVRDAIDALSDQTHRADARSGGTRGHLCRRSNARLHPPANRPAGDVRASFAGLCGDAGPRPRPPRRRAPAVECLARWGPRRWPAHRFRSIGR